MSHKTKKIKILNTIGKMYTVEAKKILSDLGVVKYVSLADQKQLKKIIGIYEIAVVGLGLNFDKDIIDSAKQLKIIATASTGTDHVDVDYATKKGIVVLSLKDDRKFLDTITGTAELAFLLILSLSRNFIPAIGSALNYSWFEKFRGHNLHGKTLGIIGLGRLGTMVAQYGKAFGMHVIAFDPYIKKNYFSRVGCKEVNFDQLLKQSDIVSIHVHLNEETENMFDKKVFRLMKKSSFLVNTSRGKIVNEKDVLEALKKKIISGYAADVLADELHFNTKFKKNPLVEYAKKNYNLLITPHVGGVTFESREATDIFIAKKVFNFLRIGKRYE